MLWLRCFRNDPRESNELSHFTQEPPLSSESLSALSSSDIIEMLTTTYNEGWYKTVGISLVDGNFLEKVAFGNLKKLLFETL